jgi:hypothetical protein
MSDKEMNGPELFVSYKFSEYADGSGQSGIGNTVITTDGCICEVEQIRTIEDNLNRETGYEAIAIINMIRLPV